METTSKTSSRKKKDKVWCCIVVIPTFMRLKWEDLEFEANLGYIVKPYLKKRKKYNGGRKVENITVSLKY